MAKRNGPHLRLNPRTLRGPGKPGVPSASVASPAIPDKLYFRIGEVASLCAVETYVLRFWQTEFAQLRPGKSGTGQRLYRKRDVEMALWIKRLLHDEGYTIIGAKTVLATEAAVPAALRRQAELPLLTAGEPSTEGAQVRLEQMRQAMRRELRELLGLLERKPAARMGIAAPEMLFQEPAGTRSADAEPGAEPDAEPDGGVN